MAELSILVPIYNVEEYLSGCLESILKQTYQDFEVICIDDGSTDGSAGILDEYGKKDSRIKVTHKNNEGYGKTMNLALKKAAGKYIGIVEPDDEILPEMYESYISDMEELDLDFVKSDFYMTWHHDDGTVLDEYSALSENADLYGKAICPKQEKEAFLFEKFTWNGVYRADFLRAHNIAYNETPGASYQDNGFWFQTMYHAKRMMFRKSAFYRYTRDNENASSWHKGKVNAFKEEYDYIYDFLKINQEDDPELYKIIFFLRMRGYLFTLNRIDASFREGFAETIRKECIECRDRNEADFSLFNQQDLALLTDICDGNLEYIKELNRKEEACKDAISGWDEIVVYGAGTVGRNALLNIKKVKEKHQKVFMAVTKLQGEKKYCYDLSVREMKEFLSDKGKVLVILAVKQGTEAYQEMKQYLADNGFENVKELG